MDNPIGGIRRGWPAIREGYAKLFGGPAIVRVAFHDFAAQGNDDFHLFVGREKAPVKLPQSGSSFEFVRPRWFVKMRGVWRQLHHHGSIDEPALLADYQRAILGTPLVARLLDTGNLLQAVASEPDQKRAEEALRQSETRLSEAERELRLTLDSIPTITWRARPDGYVQQLNKRWFEYTGMTPEQVRGLEVEIKHSILTTSKILSTLETSTSPLVSRSTPRRACVALTARIAGSCSGRRRRVMKPDGSSDGMGRSRTSRIASVPKLRLRRKSGFSR